MSSFKLYKNDSEIKNVALKGKNYFPFSLGKNRLPDDIKI